MEERGITHSEYPPACSVLNNKKPKQQNKTNKIHVYIYITKNIYLKVGGKVAWHGSEISRLGSWSTATRASARARPRPERREAAPRSRSIPCCWEAKQFFSFSVCILLVICGGGGNTVCVVIFGK